MAATFAAAQPSSSLIETDTDLEIDRRSPEGEYKKFDFAPATIDDSNVEKRQDRSAFSRANKIYQSFTVGMDRSSLMNGTGELSYSRREKDEKIDEAEKERILNIIE